MSPKTDITEKDPEIQRGYRELERIRRELDKSKANREKLVAERDEWWERLLAAEEKEAELARASGVDKTLPRLAVQRRQARARGEKPVR